MSRAPPRTAGTSRGSLARFAANASPRLRGRCRRCHAPAVGLRGWAPALLEARLERLHQIDDLRRLAGRGDLDLTARQLLIDRLLERFRVGIVVLLGPPRPGQRLDELAGQLHFARIELDR